MRTNFTDATFKGRRQLGVVQASARLPYHPQAAAATSPPPGVRTAGACPEPTLFLGQHRKAATRKSSAIIRQTDQHQQAVQAAKQSPRKAPDNRPKSKAQSITTHITSNSTGFSFSFMTPRSRPGGVENYRVNLS